ncbi:MAG: Asp23/Gls24 family envelope stress response protein [Clostridiales Family XIII bacterium]|jgi:uncharacterized alkaline shock family protein YloU|nr:Asp23/Gls24 family envelope stress response protein [Clostridiales Family XIII bacterium]
MAGEFNGFGSVTISEDVIAACVREAALRTKGVSDLFGGFQGALSQNILGKELKSKGIRVSEDEEGIVVDVQIIIDYGVKVPEVAWNLQKNVKTELENAMDAVVKAVNVGVQGVRFPAGEARGAENGQG